MAIQAGGAFIPIRPDASNFGKELTAALKPSLTQAERDAASSGKNMGTSIGKELGGAGKGLTAGLKPTLTQAEKDAATSAAKIGNSLKGAASEALGAFGGGTDPFGGIFGKAKAGIGEVGEAAGGGALALGLMGAAGVAAGVGILVAMKGAADGAAAYANSVRQVKQLTGATAEDSSLLVAELHHVGIETDTGAKAFALMGRNLTNNSAHLQRWFTDADQATLKGGDLSKVLPLLSDKFRELDAAQQSAFLQDVFGRGGRQLRELLNLTTQQIDEIQQHAKSLGLIFGEGQLEGAKAYRFAMNDLGEAFSSLKIRAGETVIPMLTTIAEKTSAALAAIHHVLDFSDIDQTGSKKLQEANALFGEQTIKVAGLKALMKDYGISMGEAKAAVAQAGGSFSKANDELQRTKGLVDDTTGLIERFSAEDQKAAQGFLQDWTKAGDAFQSQLDKLIPSDFKDVLTTAANAAKQNVSDSKTVASATDALTAAETRRDQAIARVQAKSKQTVSDQQAIANATDAVAKAQQRLDTARAAGSDSSLLDALKKDLGDSASSLEQFDALLPRLQSRLSTLRVGDAGVDQLLSRLQQQGPDSVPLLQSLVGASDRTLGGLVDVADRQIAAAKRAADFQFDKWPANFSDKLGATVKAAGQQMDQLVAQWDALPDHSGPVAEQLAQQIQQAAQKMLDLESSGAISLTDVQHELLATATATNDPFRAVSILHDALKSLDATFTSHISIDDAEAKKELDALAQYYVEHPPPASFVGPIPKPEGSLGTSSFVGPVPTYPDFPRRHAALGGIVTRPTWVYAGEAGQPEAFIPLEHADQLAGMGGAGIHIDKLEFHGVNATAAEAVDVMNRKLGWKVAVSGRR